VPGHLLVVRTSSVAAGEVQVVLAQGSSKIANASWMDGPPERSSGGDVPEDVVSGG
jgi:hypothetical protein